MNKGDIGFQSGAKVDPDIAHANYISKWLGGPVPEDTLMTEELRKAIHEKALNITDSTSAGGIVPVWVDPDIVDLARRTVPFWELMPKVVNKGKTVDYNQLLNYGDDAARFLTESNSADLTSYVTDDNYLRVQVPIKFAYAVGSYSGQSAAALRGYADARVLEVRNKTGALMQMLENKLVNGDAVGSPEEFSGLKTLLNVNTIDAGTTSAGDAIALADLRQAVDDADNDGGLINLFVMSPYTRTVVNGLIMAYQKIVDKMNIDWGVNLTSFDGVPIATSRYMPAASAASSGRDADTGRQVFALQRDVVEVRLLQDITMEPLRKVGDADLFFLKWYGCVVVKAPPFCARIGNLT